MGLKLNAGILPDLMILDVYNTTLEALVELKVLILVKVVLQTISIYIHKTMLFASEKKLECVVLSTTYVLIQALLLDLFVIVQLLSKLCSTQIQQVLLKLLLLLLKEVFVLNTTK